MNNLLGKNGNNIIKIHVLSFPSLSVSILTTKIPRSTSKTIISSYSLQNKNFNISNLALKLQNEIGCHLKMTQFVGYSRFFFK